MTSPWRLAPGVSGGAWRIGPPSNNRTRSLIAPPARLPSRPSGFLSASSPGKDLLISNPQQLSRCLMMEDFVRFLRNHRHRATAKLPPFSKASKPASILYLIKPIRRCVVVRLDGIAGDDFSIKKSTVSTRPSAFLRFVRRIRHSRSPPDLQKAKLFPRASHRSMVLRYHSSKEFQLQSLQIFGRDLELFSISLQCLAKVLLSGSRRAHPFISYTLSGSFEQEIPRLPLQAAVDGNIALFRHGR